MKFLATLVIALTLLPAAAQARHHHRGYHAQHAASIKLMRPLIAKVRSASTDAPKVSFWDHAADPLGMVMPDDCPQSRINAVFATLGIDPWH